MIKENILLIGMPGCGKSTVGKVLAEKLKYKFIDMDDFIEGIEGKSVSEIFIKGEDYFRDIETEACRRLSRENKIIIASGGGVIKRKINIDLFKDNFTIIFIDRPLENILNDVEVEKRPLLANGKEVLYKLYNERYELYNLYCNYKVINNKSLDDIIKEILNK